MEHSSDATAPGRSGHPDSPASHSTSSKRPTDGSVAKRTAIASCVAESTLIENVGDARVRIPHTAIVDIVEWTHDLPTADQ